MIIGNNRIHVELWPVTSIPSTEKMDGNINTFRMRISGKQLGFIQLETVQHLPRCQPCQASQDLHTITAEHGSRHDPTKDVKGIAIRAVVLLYLERHSLTKMTCFMNLYHWNRGHIISFQPFLQYSFWRLISKSISSLQDDSY